jgi:hypothetical protein
MSDTIAPPELPVGTVRTFGPFGEKYEVGWGVRQLEDGDWLVEITMLENGEVGEYPLSRILEDPLVGLDSVISAWGYGY